MRSFERRSWKAPGHLPGVEIALAPHHVLEKVDLALVDEQRELAGLAEVGLRRQQGTASSGARRRRAPSRRPRWQSSVPPRQ